MVYLLQFEQHAPDLHARFYLNRIPLRIRTVPYIHTAARAENSFGDRWTYEHRVEFSERGLYDLLPGHMTRYRMIFL